MLCYPWHYGLQKRKSSVFLQSVLATLRVFGLSVPHWYYHVIRAIPIDLHQSYRQTHERLASLDEALGRGDARAAPSPWEEVRDFFH